MQTAGSGPDLMSTAVIATLPVTASAHLGNPGQDEENGEPESEGQLSARKQTKSGSAVVGGFWPESDIDNAL